MLLEELTSTQRDKIIRYLIQIKQRQVAMVSELRGEYGVNGTLNDLQHHLMNTLYLMDSESQRILINEFIDKRQADWWKQYYSRSTYYRLKSIATENFLRCLNK
jgi:hypothetical protein